MNTHLLTATDSIRTLIFDSVELKDVHIPDLSYHLGDLLAKHELVYPAVKERVDAVIRTKYDSWFQSYGLGYLMQRTLIDAFNRKFEMVHPKEGRLSKRLAKWLKQTFGAKLTDAELSELGTKLASWSTPPFIHYDITGKFDWDRGTYGDHGSCFWTTNAAAKTLMMNNGGLAIRWYDENREGNGRAWLMPVAGDAWVVFNSYGPALRETVRRMEMIFPDYNFEEVELNHDSTSTGLLYINNAQGYLIYPKTLLDEGADTLAFGYLNLHYKRDGMTDLPASLLDREPSERDGRERCTCCGELVDPDDMVSVDDGLVCQSCYDESYFSCEICGDTYHNESANSVNRLHRSRWHGWRSEYIFVCDHCLRDAIRCNRCDAVDFDNNDSIVECHTYSHGWHSTEDLCPDCRERMNVEPCEACGEMYGSNLLTERADGYYCESCADEWDAQHPANEEVEEEVNA